MTLRLLVGCIFALELLTAQNRPSVILVSLDQLQADHLHVYGNARATSPNIDRMAAEGFRFSRFYSGAPWTTPSYASIMTSLYPSRHGATLFHARGTQGLGPDVTTLAETFKKAGYQTAAFVNNSNAGEFLTGRGFDDYDEGQRRATSITERSTLANPEFKAPPTTERVLRWLDQNQTKPFFLFVLYIEPHSPYDPPPEHDLFRSGPDANETNTGYDPIKGRLFRLANAGDTHAIERLQQLYDGKIHFIDSYFGRLLDRLRTSGLDKNTIVLLTSDHGELLYTHPADYRTFDHRSLYDADLHIPCIVWGKGIPRGKMSDAMATHIDIAPTLLELAGLPPKPDAQGASLVAVMQGKKKAAHQYLFCEQDVIEPLRSVRDERYKLILNERTGKEQLFDRVNDPGELQDRAAAQPRMVRRLRAVLDQWRKENEPDPEVRARRFREQSLGTYTIDEVTIGSTMQLNDDGWKMADGGGNYRDACFWSEPARAGETPRSAIWRTDNPALGRYHVSIWYGGIPEGRAATNAPFTVLAKGGAQSFAIDQTKNRGAWQDLGVFEDPIQVSVSNQANGPVIVDAVKFERVR